MPPSGKIWVVFSDPAYEYKVLAHHRYKTPQYLTLRLSHSGCKGMLKDTGMRTNVCGGCKLEFKSPKEYTSELVLNAESTYHWDNNVLIQEWVSDWLGVELGDVEASIEWP